MARTGKFRKESKIAYPNCYATHEQAEKDPAAYKFNCGMYINLHSKKREADRLLVLFAPNYFLTLPHLTELSYISLKGSQLNHHQNPFTLQTSKTPMKTNSSSAQRAHANFIENQPSALGALFIAGLHFPVAAAVLGASWSFGRTLYLYGYTSGSGPKGRTL